MKNGKYTGKQLNNSDIKYAWFKDDKYHRRDGPAVEYANGNKYWFKNDQYHREDGPAIEWGNGIKKCKEWYINGERHRLDGPAIEYSNGDKAWFYYGEYINCQSQEEFKRIIKLISFR